MNQSDSIANLAAALVKFQQDCPPITKNKTATIPGKDGKSGYSYNYADLGDTLTTTGPHLAANGLAVSQSASSDGQFVTCSTTIFHSSGEWLESDYFMLPAGGTPQTAGSALTYCRRYSYSAAVGVASEDDDDGAGATHSADAKRTDEAIGSDAPIIKAIYGKANALGKTKDDIAAMITAKHPDKNHPGDLTSTQAKALCDGLEAIIQKRKKEASAIVPAEDAPGIPF